MWQNNLSVLIKTQALFNNKWTKHIKHVGNTPYDIPLKIQVLLVFEPNELLTHIEQVLLERRKMVQDLNLGSFLWRKLQMFKWVRLVSWKWEVKAMNCSSQCKSLCNFFLVTSVLFFLFFSHSLLSNWRLGHVAKKEQ